MRPDRQAATLYVFFGLIASGKSTLAEEFARRRDFPYLNTDRVRKELAGLDPSSRRPDGYDQGIYSREFTRRTYQALLDRAREHLESGSRGVVLDGSYGSREERARIAKLAERCGADVFFILCVCGEETVRERLARRAADPLAVSDGRWDIYLVQRERFQPPTEVEPSRLLTLSTEEPVEALLTRLEKVLAKE
ncbi:MAG: hypothetical protein Kow0089_01780 [Desulfobulbaceae bacterium]